MATKPKVTAPISEQPSESKPPIVPTILRDVFDEMAFDEIYSQSTVLKQVAPLETDDHTLLADVFNAAYKYQPTINPDAGNPEKGLMENLLKLPEYEELTESTQMDQFGSAIASSKLAPGLIEEFHRVREEEEQAKKEKRERTDEEKEESETRFRVAMRRACQEAQEEVEDAQSAIGMLAGKDTGDGQHMPLGESLKLAQKVEKNEVFKKVAQLFGRLKNAVNATLENAPSHGMDEIVDIGTGSDIARLIPSEYLKLRMKPALFYKDMLEGGLYQYNLKGEEPKMAGPIFVCVDFSGSMGGEREIWAKAMILALSFLAEKQKRKFGYLLFESKVFQIADHSLSMQDKLKLLETGTRGGTSFESALDKAFEVIQRDVELRPADIVFITDGEDTIQTNKLQQYLKIKEERGVRVHAIGVMTAIEGQLAELSTSVTEVNHLGEISVAQGIFAKTANKQV